MQAPVPYWAVVLTMLLAATGYSSMMRGARAAGALEAREATLQRIKKLREEVGELKGRLDLGPKVEKVRATGLGEKKFPEVKKRTAASKKRVLVTGGAGFVGSNLVDSLMVDGHRVTVLDNFFTGRMENIVHWVGHPNFNLIEHDVISRVSLVVDHVFHLASPASPPHYMYHPMQTIRTNTEGTINMLEIGRFCRARVLFTSTSEVYGDPLEHPQKETYWGNVNPIGPRACYDEAKRLGETIMYAYEREGVDVRVVRIFNTFGPRMHPNDGRVVSNFIIQALQDKPITIYGTGEQTRSFQYVDDLVAGIRRVMEGNVTTPVNIGNPEEYTMKEFAYKIKELTNSKSEIRFVDASTDDPGQRRPDITKARTKLDWEPKVSVDEGLVKTIEYFKKQLKLNKGSIVTAGQKPIRPGYISKRT